MPAPFVHSVTPEGSVAVTVRFTDGPRTRIVEAHEIKRFAWGVLNDLDPDGVDEHHYDPRGKRKTTRRTGGKRICIPIDDEEAKVIRELRAQGLKYSEIVNDERVKARSVSSVAGFFERERKRDDPDA